MTGVGLLGPVPGDRVLEVQQAVVDVLADVPTGVVGLPPVVQVPARGPFATGLALTSSLLTEMPVELGVHGWRLADRPGRDLERVRVLVREDLDELAVAAHGWTGPLVVTLGGPVTTAATLWLARGDRVLSDHGALRDLAEALADGAAAHLRRVRTAVPGAEPVVVLREPLLADALAGAVPTFSGWSRLPALAAEVAEQRLRAVVDGLRAAGAHVVGHVGTRWAGASFATLTRVGADAVGLPADGLGGADWERVAEAVEGGVRPWFGLRAGARSGRAEDVRALADRVARPWTAVGLPASGLRDVVVHVETAGGDGLRDRADVPSVLRGAVDVATELAERAETT